MCEVLTNSTDDNMVEQVEYCFPWSRRARLRTNRRKQSLYVRGSRVDSLPKDCITPDYMENSQCRGQ